MDGIPIVLHLLAGKTSGVTTLPDVLDNVEERVAVRRTCLVANSGLISERNIDNMVEQAKCD